MISCFVCMDDIKVRLLMNVALMSRWTVRFPIYGQQARRHCHGSLSSSKTDQILNAIYIYPGLACFIRPRSLRVPLEYRQSGSQDLGRR
jgi:hypothetical protein